MFTKPKTKANFKENAKTDVAYIPQTNKILKRLEFIHVFYTFLFLIGFFIFYVLIRPESTETTNPLSLEENIALTLFMFILVFLPFHIGLKQGIKFYKPNTSLMNPKQLKKINELLRNGHEVTIKIKEKEKLEDLI